MGSGSLLYLATVILAQLHPNKDELMLTHCNGNMELMPSTWPDALVLSCRSYAAQQPGTLVSTWLSKGTFLFQIPVPPGKLWDRV